MLKYIRQPACAPIVWVALLGLCIAVPAGHAQELEMLPPLDEVLQSNEVLPTKETPIEVEADPEPAYTWYQPAYYFDPVIWDGSIEVGVNGATGNTETFNITAGYNLKRETDRWIYSSDLKYFNSSQAGIETQNYAIFNAGMEWKTRSAWSAFARTQLQYNEFQPWDLRVVLNGGLAYRAMDTDVSKLKLRFGAGASREFGGMADRWKPEAIFGMDAEQRLSKRSKLVSTLDYYPTWEDFSDYRLVSDVSWRIILDEATNMSLKIGVITNYDSTPDAGAFAQDVNYVAMLIWKL